MEDELKKFPKNKILEIFRLFNKNWWTVDSLWFSTIEKEFGVEVAKKINFKVSKAMAPVMAKRIMKTLNLKGENLQDLAKALKFIVWSTIQKIDVKEQTKDKIILEVDDDLALVNLLHEMIWKNKGVSAFRQKHPQLSKPELIVKGDAKKLLINAADAVVADVKEFRKELERAKAK